MKPAIHRYAFKEEAKTGFEIIDLGAVYARHKARMTVPHRTDFFHILLLKGGISKHIVDFQIFEIQPVVLLFINKDAVHAFENVEQVEGKGIVFLDSFFCSSEQDAQFLHNCACFNNFRAMSRLNVTEDCTDLKTVFALMDEAFQKPDEQHHIPYLRNLLHNFLILSERILRQQSDFQSLPVGMDMDYSTAFRNLLNMHFAVEKSVGFYATQLNITENRLYHATQHILGKSPKQVINDRLVLEAKRLLVNSAKPVKEISFELGFGEPTNFNQFFKKNAGLTPGEWRTANGWNPAPKASSAP
ncbi:MAG: helix-turn-helix domain-containing protein [Haliscomenobacter sp.]|jgi:AraC family transcriptional activator of pobA|nr:helix-turn-helix domain-containing protein [Haliscomenobacter sp.]MBV6429582.1 HTH-type transcriptional activator RhaS [Haliscomenobacter sp.]